MAIESALQFNHFNQDKLLRYAVQPSPSWDSISHLEPGASADVLARVESYNEETSTLLLVHSQTADDAFPPTIGMRLCNPTEALEQDLMRMGGMLLAAEVAVEGVDEEQDHLRAVVPNIGTLAVETPLRKGQFLGFARGRVVRVSGGNEYEASLVMDLDGDPRSRIRVSSYANWHIMNDDADPPHELATGDLIGLRLESTSEGYVPDGDFPQPYLIAPAK